MYAHRARVPATPVPFVGPRGLGGGSANRLSLNTAWWSGGPRSPCRLFLIQYQADTSSRTQHLSSI